MEQYNTTLLSNFLQVDPALATTLKSVDKAIIMQNLHQWQKFRKSDRVYIKMDEWLNLLPWLNFAEIRKHLDELRELHVLDIGINDKGVWYAINYRRTVLVYEEE